MRITPLILFCFKLEFQSEIISAVKAEMQLTHSDPVVLDAACAWVIAIIDLIKTGNPDSSYKSAEDYI